MHTLFKPKCYTRGCNRSASNLVVPSATLPANPPSVDTNVDAANTSGVLRHEGYSLRVASDASNAIRTNWLRVRTRVF